MKVDTVNVIEWECDTIQFVHSFTDNEKGSKSAEELFKTLALAKRCPEDEKLFDSIMSSNPTNSKIIYLMECKLVLYIIKTIDN